MTCGGSYVFRTITEHYEFVGLWQDGVPKLGVMKVRAGGGGGGVVCQGMQQRARYNHTAHVRGLAGVPPASRRAARLLPLAQACRRGRSQRQLRLARYMTPFVTTILRLILYIAKDGAFACLARSKVRLVP
jgi:hypothetical protein